MAYATNEDGSYVPFGTTPAGGGSYNLVGSGYDSPGVAEYLASGGNTVTNYTQPTLPEPEVSEPEPAVDNTRVASPTGSFSSLFNPTNIANGTNTPVPNNTNTLSTLYATNADGSYNPFPTTPAAPRSNIIPDEFTQGGGMVDTMQKAGVNPALYGALSFGAYAQPEFANTGVTGNLGNTSVADATNSYLARLKDTEAERAATSVQNQQQWANMYMNSPVYNPNGANTYAIQNNPVNTNTPLFTNNGTTTPTDRPTGHTPTNNTNTNTTTNNGLDTDEELNQTRNPMYYDKPSLGRPTGPSGSNNGALGYSSGKQNNWRNYSWNKAIWS